MLLIGFPTITRQWVKEFHAWIETVQGDRKVTVINYCNGVVTFDDGSTEKKWS